MFLQVRVISCFKYLINKDLTKPFINIKNVHVLENKHSESIAEACISYNGSSTFQKSLTPARVDEKIRKSNLFC